MAEYIDARLLTVDNFLISSDAIALNFLLCLALGIIVVIDVVYIFSLKATSILYVMLPMQLSLPLTSGNSG